jgi:hypothetical protein
MGVVFWDIMPCGSSKKNRWFGGTYRVYIHGKKALEFFQLRSEDVPHGRQKEPLPSKIQLFLLEPHGVIPQKTESFNASYISRIKYCRNDSALSDE